MKPNLVEARVSIFNQQTGPVDVAVLAALAERVLDEELAPDRCEVSVVLVGDEAMAELNSAHLGRDGPTDVLAFPLVDLRPGEIPVAGREGPPLALGDVVIAPDFARRQAGAIGVGFEDEMCLILVHGMLHLLGYDHVEDGDAELMERREGELLGRVERR